MVTTSQIQSELRKHIDLKFQAGASNFFKENVKVLGVRSPQVKQVASKFWPEIKKLPKDEIFTICEELWQSGYIEETFVAINWTNRLIKKFDKADFVRFTDWIDKYVTNWASCDIFCTHAVGYLVQQYPELFEELKAWTKSKNRWFRRAAAVSLIYPLHHLKFSSSSHLSPVPLLSLIFQIADLLFLDPDDLVQKGYGWMLKEASKTWPQEIFQYVFDRRDKMPRTALRYAIEKLSKDKKIKAMSKVSKLDNFRLQLAD